MSPIDRTVLDSLADDLGGGDAVRQVVATFLELLADRRREVEEAVEADDRRRLGRAAHVLGSSSAVVGGVELGARCLELERWEGPAAAVPSDVLEAWASTCTRTADALEAWAAAR